MDNVKINSFQEQIQYEYNDLNLLETALTHSSYANEHQLKKTQNNEKSDNNDRKILKNADQGDARTKKDIEKIKNSKFCVCLVKCSLWKKIAKLVL